MVLESALGLLAGGGMPLATVPVVAVAFAAGCLVVPSAADRMLVYKHGRLQDAWYDNLEAFELRGLWLSRDDAGCAPSRGSSAEGEVSCAPPDRQGQELVAWARRQEQAVEAGALDARQVARLREACILRPPAPGAPDLRLEGAPAPQELAQRYRFRPGAAVRVACGALLAVGAFACTLFASPVAVVAGCLALLLMEVMMLTDLKVKLIPIELTCAFAVCSVTFALAVGSLRGFAAGAAAGAGILVLLMVADGVSRLLGGRTGVGMGDKRLVPFIAILSGFAGTLYGFAAASALAFLFAVLTLAFKRGTRTSTVPYAPGLALWCYVGLFMQAAACM